MGFSCSRLEIQGKYQELSKLEIQYSNFFIDQRKYYELSICMCLLPAQAK